VQVLISKILPLPAGRPAGRGGGIPGSIGQKSINYI